MPLWSCWSRCTKEAKRTFACLARMVFMLRQRTKDLLLRARVCHQNLRTKISHRHLADSIEKICTKKLGARAAWFSSFSQPNHWCCHCRRHFLNFLLFAVQATQICNLFPESSLTGVNRKTEQNKTKRRDITRKNGKKLAHRRERSEIFCWWFFLVLRNNNNYLTSCWWPISQHVI